MQYCRRNIVQGAFAIIFPRKSSAAADATILVALSANRKWSDAGRGQAEFARPLYGL